MLEHFPNRIAPAENEIESLIGGLIRNGNQIEALRQAVSGKSQIHPDLADLLVAHRETEARLQVVIAGIERRYRY
jgi:hypothetical protein